MSESIKIVIAACGAAAVSGVCMLLSQFFQRRAERKNKSADKLTVITKAMQVTMLDRIKHLGEKYLLNGSIDIDDRRLLSQLHESYHELGGNGDLDKLMNQIEKLPLTRK